MRKIFVPDASNMPKTADVVDIGGGIVGVAATLWRSTVERDEVGDIRS